MISPRAFSVIRTLRAALAIVDDELSPAEQDYIIGAIVNDLRSRRPVAVAPLGVLPAPSTPIRDPRSAP